MSDLTLFQKIQAEIASLEAEAGIQLSAFEAKVKGLFEQHAATAAPVEAAAVAAGTSPVAAVLDTTPAAPAP